MANINQVLTTIITTNKKEYVNFYDFDNKDWILGKCPHKLALNGEVVDIVVPALVRGKLVNIQTDASKYVQLYVFEDDKGNVYHTNSEYGIRPESTMVGAFYPYCDGIGWLLAIPNIVKKNCIIKIDAKKAYDYISSHVTEYIPSEWYTKTITTPEDFFDEGNEWDSVSVYMRGGTCSMRVSTQSPGPHWVLVGTLDRIGYTNECRLSFFPSSHGFGYPLNADYNPEVVMAVGAVLFSKDHPYMYEPNVVTLPNGVVWEGF